MPDSLFNPTGKADENGDPIFEASKMARSTDPVTSVQAAENHVKSGKAKTGLISAAWAVSQWEGKTAVELSVLLRAAYDRGETPSDVIPLTRAQMSRRLPDCREAGHVHNGENRVCTVNGTNMQTWNNGVGDYVCRDNPSPSDDVNTELRQQVSDLRWALRSIRTYIQSGICGDHEQTLKNIKSTCDEALGK